MTYIFRKVNDDDPETNYLFCKPKKEIDGTISLYIVNGVQTKKGYLSRVVELFKDKKPESPFFFKSSVEYDNNTSYQRAIGTNRYLILDEKTIMKPEYNSENSNLMNEILEHAINPPPKYNANRVPTFKQSRNNVNYKNVANNNVPPSYNNVPPSYNNVPQNYNKGADEKMNGGRKIYTGQRGGKFYIKSGRKVYI